DEEFTELCDGTYDLLQKYHMLFDIYHEYNGINNLCTINKNAGGDWIEIDPLLTEFLLYAREMNELTDGEMDVMLGAVLSLWHDARNAGKPYLPDEKDLADASVHTGFSLLEIDEENNRVRITDSGASIDVGALGKGYATEKAALALEEKGVTSYVLNIGGNIRIIGSKPDGSGWTTGIRDPKNPDGDFALTISVKDTAVVTSGSYERYFVVDGVKYPHIIDKDTFYPSRYYDSLTVICKDSGLADCLSTALYSMPPAESRRKAESLDGVECIWIDADGNIEMTDGAKALVVE
ncbi:MAG: FAD:protein FMN transferase, partial [Candidatus Ornithospirochaeta sp.]